MLVLKRKRQETVLLFVDGFEPITVKVVGNSRGVVKIGVDADSKVRVVRGELVEGIHSTGQGCAKGVSK